MGLREVAHDSWLVTFMDLDIGYLDATTKSIIHMPRQPNTER